MSTSSQGTFEVGSVLDEKWVILSFIGKGGMGEVYRAHQLNLDRDVAIKVISPEFLEELSDNDYELETCLKRFHREVRVMAQVRHPNVLQVFDYGSAKVRKGKEDVLIEYIAMEYVPGGTLRSTMSAEGFHPEEDRTRDWLMNYFLPLLDGVCALHQMGIVHRDLKPENVLLDGKVPKIADFGLARSHRTSPFTQSMDMKGTPPYMPPEQFMDLRRTDERVDVYSLGKILYEAIAGKITSDQIPFKKACLPAADTPFFEQLGRVIENATEEDKNLRCQSVREMKEGIEQVTNITAALRAPVKKGLSKGTGWSARVSAVLMVILLGMVVGIGISLFHGKMEAPVPLSQERLSGSLPPGREVSGTGPPSTLRGIDADGMRLIPAGSITLPKEVGADGGQAIKVDSFYLDENQVTNYQYVEFLNKVLPRVNVENGVVKGDGQVWLFLGQVIPGYEPIVYRNGMFQMQNAAHAACPVLRVTAFGASAYARFYGKRLPTEVEWLYVVRQGRESPGKSVAGASVSPHGMHMGGASTEQESTTRPGSPSTTGDNAMMPSPVILQKPNRLGIRGMDGKVGEWARSGSGGNPNSRDSEVAYVVVGKPVGVAEAGKSFPEFVPRQPWEAFDMVGFRCALSLPGNPGTGAAKLLK